MDKLEHPKPKELGKRITSSFHRSRPHKRKEEGPASVCQTLLSQKYRQLAQGHLNGLPMLFRKLTGLACTVSWAPTWPSRWRERDLPSHSWSCRRFLAMSAAIKVRCQKCIAQHLARTLGLGHDGHRFTCFMRVRNFWLPIIVRDCVVGLAFTQALALSSAEPIVPGRPLQPSASAARAPRSTCRSGNRVGRSKFEQATKLLRLMVGHVETSVLADLRKADLVQGQQAVYELQTVATRLRHDLNRLDPTFNNTSPALEPENHMERIVHVTLEFMHQHYSKRLTLRECADHLHLNAAYLSAVFSRAVGIPFKTYLTELCIEKARELLSDPARSIADVAFAVGYASENRFRIAFKSVTGLSPTRWRDTLRMQPSPPLLPD